jgi:predicted aconitase
MKPYVPFAALFTALAMAAPLSVWADASEPASSAIANYIHNARTPEDHEAIAAHFDSEEVQAKAMAEQYNEFHCHHSKATELQKTGTPFAEVTAKRHCRKILRHYLNKAEEARAIADYHRNVAKNLRSSARVVQSTADLG